MRLREPLRASNRAPKPVALGHTVSLTHALVARARTDGLLRRRAGPARAARAFRSATTPASAPELTQATAPAADAGRAVGRLDDGAPRRR